ncbi:hypothetical protein EDB86DRAFT_2890255 [Lactarius hatsudake]|nr:hypothetical protein EDB86DRAFT_2890255 [Lactarius hatsudake]
MADVLVILLCLQHVTNVLAKKLSKSAPRLLPLSAPSHSPNNNRRHSSCVNNSPPPIPRLKPGNTDLHGAGNGVEGEDELDLFIRTSTLSQWAVKCGVRLPLRRAASSASLLSTQNTAS